MDQIFILLHCLSPMHENALRFFAHFTPYLNVISWNMSIEDGQKYVQVCIKFTF